MFHGPFPEVRVHAALDYGEHYLLISVQGLCFVKVLCKALQPALGKFQGLCGITFVGVSGAALVKGHHDIGTYNTLCVNVVFRGEDVLGAVYVGGKLAAFLREFTDGGKGKDLESAAVREDGPVPVLEFMEPSGFSEGVQSGPKIKVIGVSKDDLGFYIGLQIPVIDAFDGTHGAHRHENGGLDFPVVRGNNAGPCGRIFILCL